MDFFGGKKREYDHNKDHRCTVGQKKITSKRLKKKHNLA